MIKVVSGQISVKRGLDGEVYYIPTKDRYSKDLSLKYVQSYIEEFLQFAEERKDLTFKVDVLEGYIPEKVAPLFIDHPMNVLLPKEFHKVLLESHTEDYISVMHRRTNERYPVILKALYEQEQMETARDIMRENYDILKNLGDK